MSGTPPIAPDPTEHQNLPDQQTPADAPSPTQPPASPSVPFRPLAQIPSISNLVSIEQFSLSTSEVQTIAGSTAKQSFIELPTSNIKAGMVVVAPRFHENSVPSFDNMSETDAYFIATSRSSDQSTIFLSQAILSSGDNGAQYLRDNGFANGAPTAQLDSSNETSVLVLAPHLIDPFKASLKANSLHGATLTSIAAPRIEEEASKFTQSARQQQIRAQANATNLFLRSGPSSNSTEHLTRALGPTLAIDSPSSYSNL